MGLKGTAGKSEAVRPSNSYGVYTKNGDYMGEVVGTMPDSIGDHVKASGMLRTRTVIAIDHARKKVIIR